MKEKRDDVMNEYIIQAWAPVHERVGAPSHPPPPGPVRNIIITELLLPTMRSADQRKA